MEPTYFVAASPLRLPPTDTHTGKLAAPLSLPVVLTRLKSRQMKAERELSGCQSTCHIQSCHYRPSQHPEFLRCSAGFQTEKKMQTSPLEKQTPTPGPISKMIAALISPSYF